MREIKEYLITKKNVNVIRLNIGGEIKHYPILSIDYEFNYDRSNMDQLLMSYLDITIIAEAFNLREKLIPTMDFNDYFDIYYGKYKYLRCCMKSYEKSVNDNSYKLEIVAQQLEIN